MTKEAKNVKKETDNTKHGLLKALLIVLIIFIVLGIVASISGYIFIKSAKGKYESIANAIKEENQTFEYGSKIKYETIIEKLISSNELPQNTNIQIKVDNKLINPEEEFICDKVGDVTITVKIYNNELTLLKKLNLQFLNDLTNIEKQIIWKVEDTKKPILSGVKDIEITQGDKIDVKKGISAKDEIDGDLEVIVEGQVDINTPGEYKLTAKAVDKNGNEVSQEFKVTVKEKKKVVASSNTTASSSNKTTSSSSSSKNTSSSSSNKTSSSTNKNTSSSTSKSTASSSKSTSSSTSSKNTSSSNKSSSSNSASTKSGRLALAKAEAKRVVAKIIKTGMTKYQKAEAICYYITDTVSAQNNQSPEAYKTNYGNEAYAALVMKIAACSGRCKAVTLLCDAAGLKSQHINKDLWEHQWNKIQIDDGSWIVIDAQIGFIGDKHPLE